MTETSSENWIKSLFPFVVMCFGGFMALLDIQIVASSLQYIGGGLSAAQDEISWVQTAYLIAEIIVIPLSGWLTRVFSTRWLFTASAAGFTLTSLLCALAWNIQSMILFRALQGMLGASMVPVMFTSSLYFFPRTAPGLFRRGGRHDCLTRPGTRSRHRRLDYGYLELALAVLRQFAARHRGHNPRCDVDQNRRAGSVALKGRRIPRYRADGGRAQHARIRIGRGLALELVRRPDDPELCLDRGNSRRAVRDPKLDLCAAGGRFAGTEEPQFRGRLLSLLCDRYRHLFDNLSDPPVSGLCARVQRLADWDCDLLDRRRLDRGGSRLCVAGAKSRHALADDVRPRLIRPVDVGLQLHHQRLERRRTPGSAGAARLPAGLRGGTRGQSRPR